MTRKQKRLLYSAVQSLRPGGILVYSTCSLAAEENEAMVSRILKRFPGALETEPLSTRVAEMIPPMTDWKGKVFDERVRNARRILPSERMEGFFLCRIRKTASTLEGER
jgi:16S rRNA (cytosine1407-C5)-methyltransferase